MVSTITSKGRVTLPAEIRRHLGVATGNRVIFILEDGGEVRLKPQALRRVADLRGAAGTLKEALPWQQMRRLAREDHASEQIASREPARGRCNP